MPAILTAIVKTPDEVFVDVIADLDGDDSPTEEECEEHADRLCGEHPDWLLVTFSRIPTHPHDPDAYTAATLSEDIEDNQETFAEVLEKQQKAIHQREPEPEPEPDPTEGGSEEAAAE